jgi:NifU-like protein involved in Fe-S cluster formation
MALATSEDTAVEEFLESYRKLEHFGPLRDASLRGGASNPPCGDQLTLRLTVDESSATVTGARFEGVGCSICVVAASRLAGELAGKTLDAARSISEADVFRLLAVPISSLRSRCATTCLGALTEALRSDSLG